MKFLLFFLFILFTFCDIEEEDKCSTLQDRRACLTQKLQSEDHHCCILTEKNEENQNFICTYTAKYLSVFYKNDKTHVLSREIFGWDGERTYSTDNDAAILKYECEDGVFEFSESYYQFSEEDEKVLSSKNHCLDDIFGENKEQLKTSDESCKKRSLTQTAILAGYRCGYYNINFLGENGEKKKLEICYFISNDDIISGELNPVIIYQMDKFVTKLYGESGATYTVEMSSGNDISGTYNSKDGKLVNNNKSDEKSIKISEYFIFLFLILF